MRETRYCFDRTRNYVGDVTRQSPSELNLSYIRLTESALVKFKLDSTVMTDETLLPAYSYAG